MKKLIVRISTTSLLLALVAVVSCSKSGTAGGGGNAGTTNSGSANVLINGAGSTFDYPAFSKWFEVYGKDHPNARFNYASIGSGGGQRQLINQTADFGASDAPMTDEMMAKAPGKILHLPIVAGGVAIMYNLPDSPKLKLDGDTLANIYLGTIKKWNDPKIAALNPGVNLPDLAISPVYRTEGSGTTFIFTDYLASVNPAWAQQVGKGTSVKWPAGLGAKGTEGVAGLVKQVSGAIGYGELAYADQSKITYADMENSAGKFVSPAPDSVSAALATAQIPEDFRFSMVNAPGDKAYPIAGASWVLVYQNQKDAALGKQLVGFLRWAITDGQKISSTLDYAPLPETVQQRELKLLDTIKY